MPRRTSSVTRSGCVSAYASARVLPQEPPNTCQRCTPTCCRSRSMSSTSAQVVLPSSTACGVLLPQPRWSNMMMRYFLGSKYWRIDGLVPPPGPPCSTTTGLPFGLPLEQASRARQFTHVRPTQAATGRGEAFTRQGLTSLHSTARARPTREAFRSCTAQWAGTAS